MDEEKRKILIEKKNEDEEPDLYYVCYLYFVRKIIFLLDRKKLSFIIDIQKMIFLILWEYFNTSTDRTALSQSLKLKDLE